MKIQKFQFNWNDQKSQKVFESDTEHLSTEQRFKDQVEQLINNFGIQKENLLLDFGCGIGHHVVELAKRGYRVIGYDTAEYYINKAKKLAINHHLESLITFYNTDDFMRTKSNEFDFIYSIDFPIGYIDRESISQILSLINKTLKNGGFFLFGFLYTRENREKFLPRNKWEEKEEILYLTDEKIDNVGRRVEKYIVVNPLEDTLTEWTDISNYYYLEEIEQMMEQAGFNIIDKFKSTGKEPAEAVEDVCFIYCKK